MGILTICKYISGIIAEYQEQLPSCWSAGVGGELPQHHRPQLQGDEEQVLQQPPHHPQHHGQVRIYQEAKLRISDEVFRP